jgi:hypothetical protein
MGFLGGLGDLGQIGKLGQKIINVVDTMDPNFAGIQDKLQGVLQHGPSEIIKLPGIGNNFERMLEEIQKKVPLNSLNGLNIFSSGKTGVPRDFLKQGLAQFGGLSLSNLGSAGKIFDKLKPLMGPGNGGLNLIGNNLGIIQGGQELLQKMGGMLGAPVKSHGLNKVVSLLESKNPFGGLFG